MVLVVVLFASACSGAACGSIRGEVWGIRTPHADTTTTQDEPTQHRHRLPPTTYRLLCIRSAPFTAHFDPLIVPGTVGALVRHDRASVGSGVGGMGRCAPSRLRPLVRRLPRTSWDAYGEVRVGGGWAWGIEEWS
eukprot:scaffold5295_cov85-Isochrysis_galbana.AAC.1